MKLQEYYRNMEMLMHGEHSPESFVEATGATQSSLLGATYYTNIQRHHRKLIRTGFPVTAAFVAERPDLDFEAAVLKHIHSRPGDWQLSSAKVNFPETLQEVLGDSENATFAVQLADLESCRSRAFTGGKQDTNVRPEVFEVRRYEYNVVEYFRSFKKGRKLPSVKKSDGFYAIFRIPSTGLASIRALTTNEVVALGVHTEEMTKEQAHDAGFSEALLADVRAQLVRDEVLLKDVA